MRDMFSIYRSGPTHPASGAGTGVRKCKRGPCREIVRCRGTTIKICGMPAACVRKGHCHVCIPFAGENVGRHVRTSN